MTNAVATTEQEKTPISAIEEAVYQGNIKNLTSEQRVTYVNALCESVGLNPLTRPLEYIDMPGRGLTLYVTRSGTDQLRKIHGVSIIGLDAEERDGLYMVTATAQDEDGRTDFAKGIVPVSGKKGEDYANAVMKAECVPLDSEILTRDGFKRHDDVQVGEEVLAYDVEADETRWTPLLDVTTYSNAPVVRMASDGGQFDVICTPDHSWAIRNQPYKSRAKGLRPLRGAYANRGPDRKLVKAYDLKKSQRLILAAPETETEESLLTPTEAAILGWAVTDGTIKRVGNSVRIGICQSKEHNLAPIRELVGAVAGEDTREFISEPRDRTFPTGRTYATKPQHWWYIPSAISRELLHRAGFHDRCDLPRIVTRLSSEARRAMLQAFMLAEGDDHDIFYNGDQHVSDAFNILTALEGIATGKSTPHIGEVTRQRLEKTRHVAVSFLKTSDAGTADVWCPTTAYGTWVMRQNGRVMITGNTKAKRRVTLSICGLGFLDESETGGGREAPPQRTIEPPRAITEPSADVADYADVETGELYESDAPEVDADDAWERIQAAMKGHGITSSQVKRVTGMTFTKDGLYEYLVRNPSETPEGIVEAAAG